MQLPFGRFLPAAVQFANRLGYPCRIDLGRLIIDSGARHLLHEFPGLRTLATLSPVPGLRRWMQRSGALDQAHLDGMCRAAGLDPVPARQLEEGARVASWQGPPDQLLARLAAWYLVGAGAPDVIDPVARFHLHNGAVLQAVRLDGNTGPRGLEQSIGLMACYRYLPGRTDDLAEAFARSGTRHVSPSMLKLLDWHPGVPKGVEAVDPDPPRSRL